MNFNADREFKILMTKSDKIHKNVKIHKNDKINKIDKMTKIDKIDKNVKKWGKVQVQQQQQQFINF